MILFAISFILVFSSSYFVASVLSKNNFAKCFVNMILLAFAQIVITTESLSLFEQIKPIPYLIINILFLIFSVLIWTKNQKPVCRPDIKSFLNKIFNAVKLDKSLSILSAGWIFFIIITLLLIIFLPVTSNDGFDYHVVRCYDWLMSHSLAHFEAADIRANVFPINSEILYLWILLFTKKQLFLGSFSFVGYLLFLVSAFNLFEFIGYSMRRTLWTLIMISSFASVVVMVSGTETDLIIAGLISASIYLFTDAIKNKSDNLSLYMSSLAYALAIGTKTPALICIPAVAVLFLYLSYKYRDYKSILKFIFCGIINFVIFSSYNYILNFIDYSNIMGQTGCVLTHRNLWGIRGFIAGFIKHFFLLFDFSGLYLFSAFIEKLAKLENFLLVTFRVADIPNGLFCGDFYFNASLIEPGMGCGILSFLLIIPCWLISLIRPVFDKNRLTKIQFIFAGVFLVNMLVLSAVVVFMTFNTRFITSFILISAPMLACSYFKSNRNPLKIMYIIIAIFYFTVISTHLWGRNFFQLTKALKTKSLIELRSDIICIKQDKRDKRMSEWCNINALLDSKFNNKEYKVLIVPRYAESIIYTKIKQMQGYNYKFINAEHLGNVNVDNYDIVIVPQGSQPITNFDNFTQDKIDYFIKTDTKGRIIEYYPNNPDADVACYYRSLNGVISKQMHTENEVPTVKICGLTTNFFKKHPFVFAYKTKRYFILLNTNVFPEFKNK